MVQLLGAINFFCYVLFSRYLTCHKISAVSLVVEIWDTPFKDRKIGRTVQFLRKLTFRNVGRENASNLLAQVPEILTL